MFGKLIDDWKARNSASELEKHPIFGPVLNQLRDSLNDKTQGIGKHFSDEGKQKIILECVDDIGNVLEQPNQIQVCRLRAMEFMLLSSKFDVLIMQPPTTNGLLSGELKQRIPELAKVDKELEEYFFGLDNTPTTFDEMWDAVLMRYWVMHLYMNAYNIVRYKLGDMHTNPTKDWFRVCYLSFCIWQENTYRHELNLPPLIEGDSADLKGIMFSSWINRAQEGCKELRLAWEKSWEDCFKEPSPFTGVSV
jgi:hypothetical protein